MRPVMRQPRRCERGLEPATSPNSEATISQWQARTPIGHGLRACREGPNAPMPREEARAVSSADRGMLGLGKPCHGIECPDTIRSRTFLETDPFGRFGRQRGWIPGSRLRRADGRRGDIPARGDRAMLRSTRLGKPMAAPFDFRTMHPRVMCSLCPPAKIRSDPDQ